MTLLTWFLKNFNGLKTNGVDFFTHDGQLENSDLFIFTLSRASRIQFLHAYAGHEHETVAACLKDMMSVDCFTRFDDRLLATLDNHGVVTRDVECGPKANAK